MPAITHEGDPMTSAQLERSAGVLVGQACGEALALALRRDPDLGTDASWASDRHHLRLGWWGRGTNLTARIADITARAGVLTEPGAHAEMSRQIDEFLADRDGKRRAPRPAGSTMSLAVAGLAGLTGLDRMVLPAPDPRARTADSARAIAQHLPGGQFAADACVLWAEAVRVAVSDGRFDLAAGVDLLPVARRDGWSALIERATGADPVQFAPCTGPVPALQMAWAAITSTPVPDHSPRKGTYACEHLQHALLAAANASAASGPATGNVVAAMAGSLLGARWGLAAFPISWLRGLRGTTGLRARDLVRLGALTARAGQPARKGWPSKAHIVPTAWTPLPAINLKRHPQLWMGGVGSWGHDADAIVSLSVRGVDDVPEGDVAPENHIEIWIISTVDPDDNPNYDFAVDQAATAIRTLLEEGRRVFVHCTRAVHRTPVVVNRFLTLQGVDPRAARGQVRRAFVEGGYREVVEELDAQEELELAGSKA